MRPPASQAGQALVYLAVRRLFVRRPSLHLKACVRASIEERRHVSSIAHPCSGVLRKVNWPFHDLDQRSTALTPYGGNRPLVMRGSLGN